MASGHLPARISLTWAATQIFRGISHPKEGEVFWQIGYPFAGNVEKSCRPCSHNNLDLVLQMNVNHVPVMLNEVMGYLEPKSGQVIVDATFGFGGHARKIAPRLGPTGKLIGFERDRAVFEKVKGEFDNSNVTLVNENFINLKANLEKHDVKKVDSIYFDLGVSTFHYHQSGRGFSFSKAEPLDMRLDESGTTAEGIVNQYSESELADLFFGLAQEHRSRQIARAIVERRKQEPIQNSVQLSNVIEASVRRTGRIHPATKVFQALRIAVNDELENIPKAIDQALSVLKSGGKILIITFHSGEDRIVKNKFKQMAQLGVIEVITKKVVKPSRQEVLSNPPSRSAKIRVARRV